MKESESIFKSVPLSYDELALDVNWNEFFKVVKSRRSVRVFEKEQIPESDVRDCIEAALLAPNSSNLQPWEFYWVRSSEKKAKLVEACFSQPAAATASDLIVCVARTKTWRRNRNLLLASLRAQEGVPRSALKYYEKIVPMIYTVGFLGAVARLRSVLFFFAGMFRPVPREPSSVAELKSWAIKTTALACENLMLAFRAKGFDSCPMEGMDSRRVRKLLELPSDAVVVMVVGAGRRAKGGVYGPRMRLDPSLFTFEV